MLVTLSVCASHFDLLISNMPEGESSLWPMLRNRQSTYRCMDTHRRNEQKHRGNSWVLRTVYHELISKTEQARRSGGESMGFDRYDAASLLVLAAAAALILLPVLLI
jgi:hypothetical protein